MTTAPQISIVTVNLNNGSALRRTIESVVAQTFRKIEYIVIDGGSTDDSVRVVEQYQDQIQYWVSEKDEGIYNAMNKGIRRATGDYLLFLNSGDLLTDTDTLLKVSPFLDGAYELVYGNSTMKSSTTEYTRVPSEKMRFSEFINRQGPHHQSSFIKRTLFNEIGFYNERYKILADWEFFLKIIFKFEKLIKYIPFVIACYDLNGISSNQKNRALLLSEKESILRENYPRFFEDYKNLSLYEKMIGNSRVVKAYLKYVKGVRL